MLALRPLTLNDEQEFLSAHRATTPDFPNFLHYYEEGMEFERYIERLAEVDMGINLPTDKIVPSSFLFAFDGERIVGRTSIRHRLNEFLMVEGGHIGYAVVPEFRRRGFATEILKQAMEFLYERTGTTRILVTCDDDNVGSIRTIEKNGGVLENVIGAPERDTPLRRYWIVLD